MNTNYQFKHCVLICESSICGRGWYITINATWKLSPLS